MASSDRAHLDSLFRAIHAVIRKIPRGRVATYGQVAELAGLPGGARVAAASLKTYGGKRSPLPWQRVLGKAAPNRARIKILDPVGAAIQRQLLEREGVEFDVFDKVALDRYGWLPTGGSSRAASPRRRPRSGSTRRASSSRR
ncbi:MAG TPA: MGMT family protein [Kofleriaceae bacterium]|jgi:methylated-DNA-protein-cysteine methyltransferase-like protein